MALLKLASKVENSCKFYVLKTSLMKLNSVKIASFKTLQLLLFKLSYLVHFNSAKHLYINLNVFKFFGFNIMIYYIKKPHTDIKKGNLSKAETLLKAKIFLLKFSIQPIMFLSRLLKPAKTHY